MLGALRYHVRHLADFTGRDARQTFWYWFLFLFILNIAISFVATLPTMIDAMAIGYQASQAGQPEAAEAMIAERMGEHVTTLVGVSIALGVFNLTMIAAAFVRRLHDSGQSGIWAILAGLIYLVSLYLAWAGAGDAAALMEQMAAAQDPSVPIGLHSRMAWQNLLGYVPIVMVIGFGLLRSEPEANRFGEAPVRF
jgi:uncharacterized membrane protein YhaH (DUF805 family)